MKYLIILLSLTGCTHEFWWGDGKPNAYYYPRSRSSYDARMEHYDRMGELITIYQMEKNDRARGR